MTTGRDLSVHAFVIALDTLRKGQPSDLAGTMEFVSAIHGLTVCESALSSAIEHVHECGPNDAALHSLTLTVQAWDNADHGTWVDGTSPRTLERRQLILQRLGLTPQQQAIVNNRVLRFSESDLPIVIAEEHEEWYSSRRVEIQDFYWRHYQSQLLPPRGGWKDTAVSVLNESVEDVVSRLSDPVRDEVFPVKGLVMGYVQSGKTSHFGGLIAKAVDAGYRLVIVLAGTLEILRRQTQRRIDKDIVGKELLGSDEYGGDAEWAQFVEHGGRPSDIGAFDWERLTNRDDDYAELSRHLSILEFRSVDRTKPFNHRDNLRAASAKLAVVKKIPKRLEKLCDDLEKLGELRSKLEHVPTLIIDDESDQASINTVDPRKVQGGRERTRTNEAIVRLLTLLPRAQYVGYTATPFANVFIDPNDAEDLFPKDFIVSLPRPKGYMGVSDFFDFEQEYTRGDYRSNEQAFVRSVLGGNEDPDNLPRAIDSFVLAGAIKLYREAIDPSRYQFRHHTMLVHHAATRVVHEADRKVVDEIFRDGRRYQESSGRRALEALFESDFKLVSTVRAPDDPMPGQFSELVPFVSSCLTRICSGKAVRVVNGDGRNIDDTPDFDQGPVWAILVGGTKLSRGYTVEGLTVSYYRRRAGAGDTLMQMGRWFGFRDGYRDLVRLFIGRKEQAGRVQVDLYHAFGAVCRDEEALRSDLLKYSKEGLKPWQVPPLVRQHLPNLPPTSRNKMFNAEIHAMDYSGDWTEKTSAPNATRAVQKNLQCAKSLLAAAELTLPEMVHFRNADGKARRFTAVFGSICQDAVLEFLRGYRWADGRSPIALEMSYIEQEVSQGRLDDWTILLPQATTAREPVTITHRRSLSVIERSRVSESRFGVYSEPRHREAAAFLAGVADLPDTSDNLAQRRRAGNPVLVLYFVVAPGTDPAHPSVGFGIQYPGVKKQQPITWMVRERGDAASVVVPSS